MCSDEPARSLGGHPMLRKIGVLMGGALSACSACAATVLVQVQDAAGKPLPEAIVFLDSREAQKLAKPIAGAQIAQINKQFAPRVLVVPVGTAVSFPNRDTVRHHVYSFSPTKTFELKLYSGTSASPVVFDRAGIAILGCNIHDNMSAWVLVVETPYYTYANEAGTASLRDVPPGNYQMHVWHRRLPVSAPALEQSISVGADANISVRLSGLMP